MNTTAPTTIIEPSSTSSMTKDGTAPSVFVTKLFQMVNGSPDDVVAWVPSGDAFLIQNLSRLETESLPRFFRHARFQSLVRQLNFYNFRKINRERTFWVYRHPLFHRDRPQDLHLLKRRSVLPPGIGAGGKQQLIRRTTSLDEGYISPGDGYYDHNCPNQSFDESMETESIGTSSLEDVKRISSKKAAAGELATNQGTSISNKAQVFVLFPEQSSDGAKAATLAPAAQKFRGKRVKETATQQIMACDEKAAATMFERAERTQLVSQVAQKLQEYGHQRDGPRFNKFHVNNVQLLAPALITPPNPSIFKFNDAMSYQALTYDDEIKKPVLQNNNSNNTGVLATATATSCPSKCGVITDVEDTSVETVELAIGDTAKKSGDRQLVLDVPSTVSSQGTYDAVFFEKKQSSSSTIALGEQHLSDIVASHSNDPVMVAVVHQKILHSTIYDNEDETSTSAAICRLLMSTDPNDSDLGKKVSLLMDTCSVVEREFKRYCVALFPHLYPPSYNKSFSNQCSHHFFPVKPPEKNTTCRDTEFDRIFTSFALNWLEGLLRCASNSRSIALNDNEKVALKQSAQTWFGSVIASH